MRFAIAGILKRGTDQQMMDLRDEWNQHLAQPFRRISLMGALRNKDGKRVGYLILFDADDWADAQSYLDQSPFYRNGLYERVDVAEFAPEIGFLE